MEENKLLKDQKYSAKQITYHLKKMDSHLIYGKSVHQDENNKQQQQPPPSAFKKKNQLLSAWSNQLAN